jgi:hypothetical protein
MRDFRLRRVPDGHYDEDVYDSNRLSVVNKSFSEDGNQYRVPSDSIYT